MKEKLKEGQEKLKEEIDKNLAILKSSGVILYPTDTIWGLGCDATDDLAIEKLLNIKRRPVEKGMIILISTINDLDRYAREVPSIAYELMEYAERPLTLVLEEGKGISKKVLKENGSVAIRVVKSGFCYDLIRAFKKPIVSTSANISGIPSPSHYDQISQQIKEEVDHIVPLTFENKTDLMASTILRLDKNGTIEFIRR